VSASSGPDTLIFGCAYIDSQERKWLADQWLRTSRALNPGAAVAVIETPGPVEWYPRGDHGFMWDMHYKFDDNVGHLTVTGRDGWGRAFATGLDQARAMNYKYAVHVECDLLFVKPVRPIIQRMAERGIKALSTVAMPHRMIETGLLFLDLEYVRESRLVERYDWETSSLIELPERRMEKLLGDDLYLLPLWGFRDDDKVLQPATMASHFPAGMDWLTHASVPCYKRFLDINGMLG
jgi:hypothetical protein